MTVLKYPGEEDDEDLDEGFPTFRPKDSSAVDVNEGEAMFFPSIRPLCPPTTSALLDPWLTYNVRAKKSYKAATTIRLTRRCNVVSSSPPSHVPASKLLFLLLLLENDSSVHGSPPGDSNLSESNRIVLSSSIHNLLRSSLDPKFSQSVPKYLSLTHIKWSSSFRVTKRPSEAKWPRHIHKWDPRTVADTSGNGKKRPQLPSGTRSSWVGRAYGCLGWATERRIERLSLVSFLGRIFSANISIEFPVWCLERDEWVVTPLWGRNFLVGPYWVPVTQPMISIGLSYGVFGRDRRVQSVQMESLRVDSNQIIWFD